jgi:hypothetical protein
VIPRFLLAAVLLVAFTGCNRPPQWVLWTFHNADWQAQSEHPTLDACRESAEVFSAQFKPKCMPMGVKP